MRRRYLPQKSVGQKPFVNNYHVCQVPLPYYNPLQDPHLKGYFSSQKVHTHINQMGLVYSPKKEYPYLERRSKNFHKHLKDNLCKVPEEHIIKHSGFDNRSYLVQSQRELSPSERDPHMFAMPKRKAGSQILNKTSPKWMQLNDALSKRPESLNRRKRNYSPDVRSKSQVFERRNYSSRKRQVERGENAEEVDLLS